jgi:3-oxoacyl-[acyl-carrier-protein] synthase III
MKIRDIAIALPCKCITSKDVANWCGLDTEFISSKIGIENRLFLGPKESLCKLVKEACENLFARNPSLDRDKIQLLILVTQNPDFKLPHSSALIQHDLSLNTMTACFDINLGCSGYVYALSIAKGIMMVEDFTEGILVTCDPYSKIMAPWDRNTIALFGDAATATWLSAKVGGELGKADLGTDGAGAQHLIVKVGGSRFPLSCLWQPEDNTYSPKDVRLQMNGRAVFKFMMERIPESVCRCLAKNKTSISEIDYFVFHQASKFLLDKLTLRMNLEAEKVPCNLKHIGNTISSSIPILLSQMIDKEMLSKKKVLISGFGVGLSWATNILQF